MRNAAGRHCPHYIGAQEYNVIRIDEYNGAARSRTGYHNQSSNLILPLADTANGIDIVQYHLICAPAYDAAVHGREERDASASEVTHASPRALARALTMLRLRSCRAPTLGYINKTEMSVRTGESAFFLWRCDFYLCMRERACRGAPDFGIANTHPPTIYLYSTFISRCQRTFAVERTCDGCTKDLLLSAEIT